MCDSNIKPKFKTGDKVKTTYKGSLSGEFEVICVGGVEYSGKQLYVCYKEGFNGHSAASTLGGNFLYNTKYKGQCWNFTEDELELVKQPPKNYRELTPDTLIDISIDGNEFKVPLGDLIHAKALIGGSTGTYGYNIWEAFHEVLDKENTILDGGVYPRNDTFKQQQDLIKIYFIDKEKEALKEVIEKQREEISKLEKELIALDDYDGCSL